jgi:hypothetical protein
VAVRARFDRKATFMARKDMKVAFLSRKAAVERRIDTSLLLQSKKRKPLVVRTDDSTSTA